MTFPPSGLLIESATARGGLCLPTTTACGALIGTLHTVTRHVSEEERRFLADASSYQDLLLAFCATAAQAPAIFALPGRGVNLPPNAVSRGATSTPSSQARPRRLPALPSSRAVAPVGRNDTEQLPGTAKTNPESGTNADRGPRSTASAGSAKRFSPTSIHESCAANTVISRSRRSPSRSFSSSRA